MSCLVPACGLRAIANCSRAPRFELGSSLRAVRGVGPAQQLPAARLGSGNCPCSFLGAPSGDMIAVDGGTVRKKSAGLLSLVVAAGLGTTLGMPATTASAAPQVARCRPMRLSPTRRRATLCPTLRTRRSKPCASRRSPTCSTAGDRADSAATAPSSRWAPPGPPPPRTARPEGPRRAGPVRRARPRGAPTSSSCSSCSSATSATRATPTRTPTRTSPGPPRSTGPLFNQIPEPDRSVDNSTDWNAHYGKAYYQDLYFGNGSVTGTESMQQYYEKQSSGRYCVDGLVTDWVTVRYNEARYGRSNGFPCASNVCSNTWNLVRDGDGRLGRRTRRPPARPTPQIKATSRTSTSGTATTSTATATSTSPTATSTTSRSCTRAATRPTVTRPGRGRHLVAPLAAPSRAPARAAAGITGRRRHASRQHRHLGRRLHRAARERRPVGLRARVRPRPRPARPLRHLRPAGEPREPGQLVDPDGPEPRLRPRRQRASARAPPTWARGTSCSSAGSTTRSSCAGQRRTLELGPHEYNSQEGPGRRRRSAGQDGDHRPRRTRSPGPSSGTPARVTTSTTTHVALGHPPGRHRVPVVPGALEHRGLRTRPVRLRLRRGRTTAPAARPSPATSPRPPRATASTATRRPGPRPPSTCRPTPARPSALRVRYSTDGAAQGTEPGRAERHLRRRHRADRGRHHAAHRRRRDQPQRLDARRLLARSARRRARTSDAATTSRATASTCRSTST